MEEMTYNDKQENKQESNTIDVVPVGKGKRILLFLADLFLNFILSFVVLNLMVVPLGKLITQFDYRTNSYNANLTNRAVILYENGVVIDSGKVDKGNLIYNVSFSYYCYLSYYCYDEESPLNLTDPHFGHKESNEVIKHYFVDILSDTTTYSNFITTYKLDKYFDISGINLTLKDEYKNQIAPYFKVGESASETGKKYIDKIETAVFYPLYSEVMTLIEKNDLSYDTFSYKDLSNKIVGYESYLNTFITATSFIAFGLSTIVLYLIIPIFNSNRRTLAMMIMKMDRISFDKLNLVKKYECVVSTIYALLTNMIIVFFIPMLQTTIYELFNIPVLYIFGLLSIALMLGSLVFLLFNHFNRTLFDYLTRMVYLKSDELDKIYRAKGYYI